MGLVFLLVKFNIGFLLKVINKNKFLENSDVHHNETSQRNHLHASKGIHILRYITFTIQGIYIWTPF